MRDKLKEASSFLESTFRAITWKSKTAKEEALAQFRSFLQKQGLVLEDNGDVTCHGEKVAVADIDGLRYAGGTLECSMQVITPIDYITTTITLERAEAKNEGDVHS